MTPDSSTGTSTTHEPIVAVFDTKTQALRTVAELTAAEFDDIWLAVVRGENDRGETLAALEAQAEVVLRHTLVARGSLDEHARRFDGILPPGTAVMSLRVRDKFDHAIRIIEITGGHVEHF